MSSERPRAGGVREPKRVRWLAPALCVLAACSSLPDPKHRFFEFPKQGVYLGRPPESQGPYERLGVVKTKLEWPTLSPDYDETRLCQSYFNKAMADLLKRAREQVQADAVIEARSVVLLVNGQLETHPRAECSDDGQEGQVLAQGIAIRYLPPPVSKQIDPARLHRDAPAELRSPQHQATPDPR